MRLRRTSSRWRSSARSFEMWSEFAFPCGSASPSWAGSFSRSRSSANNIRTHNLGRESRRQARDGVVLTIRKGFGSIVCG